MATIVAAAMTSHAPNITATPAAAPEQRGHFLAGLAELRKRLAATRPDVVVMFVNDHVQNFFYDNLPAFCVGVGARHWAPRGAADFLKIPSRQLPGAVDFGKALLKAGRHTTAQFVKEVQQEVDVELAGFPLRTFLYRNDCTLPARAHIENVKRDRLF